MHWLQAVQERAEDVQEQAEDISDSSSPAQEQAAAGVQETVTEAAPEEDLGDILSVLQGAESAMDEPESSQVPYLQSQPFLVVAVDLAMSRFLWNQKRAIACLQLVCFTAYCLWYRLHVS